MYMYIAGLQLKGEGRRQSGEFAAAYVEKAFTIPPTRPFLILAWTLQRAISLAVNHVFLSTTR